MPRRPSSTSRRFRITSEEAPAGALLRQFAYRENAVSAAHYLNRRSALWFSGSSGSSFVSIVIAACNRSRPPRVGVRRSWLCGLEPDRRPRRSNMSRGFEAVKTVTIHATQGEVWNALTNHAQVKQYLHGTEMSTDWKEGSPISWKGEWKGQSYEDKGTVLAVEPERLLRYTHWSPMGGSEDKPDNYHTVTYELAGEDGKTTLTLTQDNNPTQEEADKMANDNWGPVLNGLKESVEKQA